jgi:hypothetical protein
MVINIRYKMIIRVILLWGIVLFSVYSSVQLYERWRDIMKHTQISYRAKVADRSSLSNSDEIYRRALLS